MDLLESRGVVGPERRLQGPGRPDPAGRSAWCAGTRLRRRGRLRLRRSRVAFARCDRPGMSTLGDRSRTAGARRNRPLHRTPGRRAVRATQWRRGVSIGDALAEARSQAGLTITQVSQRPASGRRSSGGSSAVTSRRAAATSTLAVTSAASPEPSGSIPSALIREYDAMQGAPQAITAADVFEPVHSDQAEGAPPRRTGPWPWSWCSPARRLRRIPPGVVGAHGLGRPRGHGATPAQPAQRRRSPPPRRPRTRTRTRVVIQLTATRTAGSQLTRPDRQQISQGFVARRHTRSTGPSPGGQHASRQPGRDRADRERQERGHRPALPSRSRSASARATRRRAAAPRGARHAELTRLARCWRGLVRARPRLP